MVASTSERGHKFGVKGFGKQGSSRSHSSRNFRRRSGDVSIPSYLNDAERSLDAEDGQRVKGQLDNQLYQFLGRGCLSPWFVMFWHGKISSTPFSDRRLGRYSSVNRKVNPLDVNLRNLITSMPLLRISAAAIPWGFGAVASLHRLAAPRGP